MTTAASSPPAARSLPLAGLHRRLGATLAAQGDGPAVPVDYGSVADEYAALREGVGLADRSAAGRLELLGADRHRFLNAYLTCDVKALAPGQGAYGFVTSPQGRILADAVVLVHDDRLWVELPPGTEAAIAAHLRKYVLADRVEIRTLDDMLPITLIGPRAVEALGGVELPAAPLGHAKVRVHGTEVALARTERFGAPAFTLWVSASIAGLLVEALLEQGARPVGTTAPETRRVEAGIPRFGHEFGPQNFPQETGDEAAVSYTKGCYLGQEVVARIHYRGGVQKGLRGLLFEPAALPAAGTSLLADGREAGTIGTTVQSIALGRPIGLAILHKRACEPGTRLEIAGGGTAEVTALPFVPA
ncbi:MAG TPA: glycine cleavage T C-terminal barrel domain-containing protein [Thermoanaerobaculia bacterium]